jgi:hypothetical protein
VWGGYPSGGGDDRDITVHETILSGDLDGNDNVVDDSTYNDNAYHVALGVKIGADSGTALDGLTISGGVANEADGIMVGDINIYRNSGGGMYNKSSSPKLTNVTIADNTATSGGGMYNDGSSPVLTNVTISGNKATSGSGGGMSNYDSSSPQIRNSIIWGNTAENEPGIYNSNGSTPAITYSIVQGESPPTGTGNKNDDPSFVPGTYTLKAGSPAIDAGNNAYYESDRTPDLSAVTTDLAGNTRIVDGDSIPGAVIDMGAYEYQTP